MERIFIAPDLRGRISWLHNAPEVCIGAGSRRRSYTLGSPELLAVLLTHPEGQDRDLLAGEIQAALGADRHASDTLIDALIIEGLLSTSPVPFEESARMWESSGWQDALDFHLATQSLEFNQDSARYVREMQDRLAAVAQGVDDPSPAAFKYHSGIPRIALPPVTPALEKVTLREVLRSCRPFRSYGSTAISLTQLSDLLHSVYGVTSEHTGILGHYFKRSSPSGGGRQPVEAYLCVNQVDALSPGLYHYMPREHGLEALRLGDFSGRLTKACFGKPGIEKAAFVVLLTVRWFRHMWKYRYARSYRMTLFDVGHLIQTHVMAGAALNLQAFLCPSLHDSECQDLLNLPSDAEEGVLYAIGMGARAAAGAEGYFFPDHAY